jgi:hypothetical protein
VEPKVRECALRVIQTDQQTIAFLRRFASVEAAYLAIRAFVDRCPTMHPENIHAFLGSDRKFDPAISVARFKSWEESLRENPDAQLPLGE